MSHPPPQPDPPHAPTSEIRLRTGIVVIGACQAGLSAAYHLTRLGVAPTRGFIVLDHAPAAGGAWQFRWPSLTLSTVNRTQDLLGIEFLVAVENDVNGVRLAV